jgi:hypothetical protein
VAHIIVWLTLLALLIVTLIPGPLAPSAPPCDQWASECYQR